MIKMITVIIMIKMIIGKDDTFDNIAFDSFCSVPFLIGALKRIVV